MLDGSDLWMYLQHGPAEEKEGNHDPVSFYQEGNWLPDISSHSQTHT